MGDPYILLDGKRYPIEYDYSYEGEGGDAGRWVGGGRWPDGDAPDCPDCGESLGHGRDDEYVYQDYKRNGDVVVCCPWCEERFEVQHGE